MYEMLTSERLFMGESDFTTLERVRNADVRPPSTVVPVPNELEDIIMRALTREPDDRWSSAAEMHHALQRFLANRPTRFTASDLSAWMNHAFKEERESERERLDQYARIGKQTTVGGPAAPTATATPPASPAPASGPIREGFEQSDEDTTASARGARNRGAPAHAEQTAKDRAAYGAVFGSRNKEGLYANEEEPGDTPGETRERAAASAGAGASGEGSDGDADPALRALQNMSEEELKARCKAVGVDLDNPRVVKELGKRAKARKEEELKAKAREMGIDLGDPSVRKMLELLEKEERGAEELSRLPAWRRWIYHSFDGTRWLNVQNAMYAALAVSREELSPRFFRFLLQKVQRCVVLTSRFPPTQVNVVYRVWKVINMPEVSPRGYPGDDEF